MAGKHSAASHPSPTKVGVALEKFHVSTVNPKAQGPKSLSSYGITRGGKRQGSSKD